ncbi:Nucleoporin Nic96 [Tubulinosema ratisbonensis]|uniref:Nucleoporin Nic96 n=1 Tax=Tubulinosema ratisbonensis TaxID=291195 RepID=A0A437AQD0_9MICR|nr:Nucleoporin Nic96 [Tubulinosema ratisbonensis]
MPMLRGNRTALVPFIKKPMKFNNYSQMISEMKEIKAKSVGINPSKTFFNDIMSASLLEEKIKNLGNIFKLKEDELSLEEIIQSVQEEKIMESFSSFENESNLIFMNDLTTKIFTLKRQKESKIVLEKSININDVKFIENNINKILKSNDFTDPLLGDLFEMLIKNERNDFLKEKEFLEKLFLKHIDYFYKNNSENLPVETLSVEQKIQDYVKMRFNRTDFKIEVYEGRYLYAEMYVLFRCGLYDKMKILIENIPFFQVQFIEALLGFLDGSPKKEIPSFLKQKDDLFKQTLYKLITLPPVYENNLVISTFEDVLWASFVISDSKETIDFNKFIFDIKQNRIKLLVAILTKNYDEAVKILINGEFSSLDTFYLSRELLKKSETEVNLFLNFAFLICQKCSTEESKLRLVNSLKFLNYKEICLKIIEFEMLEVVSNLPDEFKEEIIKTLRNSNNRNLLLKLHFVTSDTAEISVLLEDALNEEINSENNLSKLEDFAYFDVYTFLRNKNCIEENTKLSVLINFLKFKIERNIESLGRTDLFKETNFNILKELDCTEKIILLACEVVLKENSQLFAKKLVEIATKLNISNYSQQLILKRLVYVL